MQEHTAYAAHAAAAHPSGQAQDEENADADMGVGVELYKAALGNTNLPHYLTAFARFDATGRALSGWNWAAALCTLCWLVFWRLWSAALIYALVLAVGAGLLAAAVLGGSVVPTPMLAGLGLAGLLLLCVVPGMYGDALLHMTVVQRVAHAVQQASNLREAASALQERAATRSRLWAIALIGSLLLALGGGAGWVLWRSAAGQPVAAAPEPTVAPSAVVPPSTTEAVTPPQDAKAPEAAPATAESGAVLPDGVVPGAAVPADTTAAAVAAPEPEATPDTVAQPVEPAPRPEASDQPATPETQAAHPPAPGKKAKAAARADARAPAAAASPAKSVSPNPQGAAQRKLYVNVGTFGDADNARRAQDSLRKAGLPVQVQQTRGAGGRKLHRVRVGPFDSASKANDAARKARALGLEAVPDAR